MGTISTRVASNLSAGVVAGIAAWSSYHHMVSVALSVGERPDVAYVLPLSVDGMLVVASVAMVDDRRNGRKVRWSARLAFVAGVSASVAANVAAAQPTVGARIVAAWPAVALLLTVELLSRTGRLLTRKSEALVEPPAAEATQPVPGGLPATTGPAAAAVPVSPPVPVSAPVGPVTVPVVQPTPEPLAYPVPSAPRVPVQTGPAYAGHAAEDRTFSTDQVPVGATARSYVDDVTPLAAPRRSAPAMPDPFPTPVSPAVGVTTTTLPSSTRIAVAQALPPAGPTATRQANERRARAAQSPSTTTRTSARVSSARPRATGDDGAE